MLATVAIASLVSLGLTACFSLPGVPTSTAGGDTPSTSSSPSSPSSPSPPGGGTQTSSPSSPSGGDWPAEVVSNYLQNCETTSGGQVAYCECTLEILQSLYSLDEFEKLEEKLATDPSILKKVQEQVKSCATELK